MVVVMTEGIVLLSNDEDTRTLMIAPELAHIYNLRVNVKNRYIYMSEIEEDTDEELSMVLDYFAHTGMDEVTIRLNSPGGDVKSMFAIHDLIRTSPRDICVYGYGEICSAAVLILACAPRRVVSESCVLMSHESTVGESELGLRAAKERRKWEDWTHTWWCDLMARYTPDGQDAAWWRKKTEKTAEYWLLGGKAIVEAGLADEVAHE